MSIKNGNLPANPIVDSNGFCSEYGVGGMNESESDNTGLTKREQFAMAAMQGFCGDGQTQTVSIPKMAVEMADALLEKLEK